jgi:hypothetical protein
VLPLTGGTLTGALNGTTAGFTRVGIGIGGAAPALPLEVSGTSGLPASSGTTQAGIVSFSNTTGGNILDIGAAAATPYGMWLQAQDRTALGTYYPILLNPNGGNVGIGLANPTTALHVNGTVTANTGTFSTAVRANAISGTGNGASSYWYRDFNGPPGPYIQFDGSSGQGGAENWVLLFAGGSGTTALGQYSFVNSNCYFPGGAYKPGGGVWGDSSDVRTKKDINDYTRGLEAVVQLRPVSFRHNGKGGTPDDGKIYIGLIANEAVHHMPEMVSVSGEAEFLRGDLTDVLTLDATALIYALVNSVRELSARLEAAGL